MQRDDVHLPSGYLDKIVESIVGAVPTDSIYLFGSYARGDETPESDIDLYVVVADSNARPLRCGAAVRKSLLWMDRPKDVLAESRTNFNELARDLWNVENAVQREGVLLYAAA
jgi:predicted nucleotidyltransferase